MSTRCAFIKEDGLRCNNNAKTDSQFCHVKHKHPVVVDNVVDDAAADEAISIEVNSEDMDDLHMQHMYKDLRAEHLKLQKEFTNLMRKMGELVITNERLENNLHMAQCIIQESKMPNEEEREMLAKIRLRKAKSVFYHTHKANPEIRITIGE